jgi:hypothetical protein
VLYEQTHVTIRVRGNINESTYICDLTSLAHAISRPMLKFCTLHCTAKFFQYIKNKKICNAKKNLLKKTAFLRFSKKLAMKKFFIFCLLLVYVQSKMVHEKNGGHRPFFQLHKEIGYFRVNFVRVCCHSNELRVTKTDIN